MASQSLIKKLKEKQELIRQSSQGSPYHLIPEGTTRFRIVPVGDDQDFSLEVIHFYPNKEIGGFISPAQWGEKCAFMDYYNQLKESKNDKDREFAKTIRPRKKYLIPAVKYTTVDGGVVDESAGVRCILAAQGVVNHLIDFFIDEKDNGDFTDPINGYDVKIKRTGKSQYDTEYTVTRGKVSRLDKKYRTPVNLEKMARDITPSYEETKLKLKQFLGTKEGVTSTKKKKKKIVSSGKKSDL